MAEKKLVRGTDTLASPDIYVGKGELTLGEPELQKILEKLGLEYLLINYWGFDGSCITDTKTQLFYEESFCRFRNRSGEVVEDVRYSGKERLDDEWLLEGNPSQLALDVSRKDLSYLREIRNLSRRAESL